MNTVSARGLGRLTVFAALLAAMGNASALPDRLALSAADVLARLQATTGNALVSSAITNDAYTAAYAVGGALLSVDDSRAMPADRAQSFLAINGALPGVTDAAYQLKPVRISTDGAGNTHVHLDQFQSGLPVFGARLVVHMNKFGITGINGVFVQGLESLSITPQLDIAVLRSHALAAASKLHPKVSNLQLESSRLMFYRSGLLQSLPGSNRLAYEVMINNGINPSIRERIILDANSGTVLNRIDEIHSLLNRIIYTPTYGSNPPVYTEKQALPPAPADPAFKGDVSGSSRVPRPPADNLYIFAGGTWQLYKNMFGRDGYDEGAVKNPPQKQESVYLINDQCPNAYWNGTSTNYCPGFDADDIVSHEWSHAYTEYTHGLVYQYQSGALNESYSDIFGETYDLVNGIEGPQGASLTEGTTYDKGGSRWVVGEDLSQAAAAVLLRDMWDPDSFPTPSPGSVITSTNYACGTGDNGGVHTNSGVSNHAFAMLVDGKAFNKVTVPKIGLVKAAHIYFQAETHHQTPTTNYPQHADALEQSCRDLIGVPLNDVMGAVSTETISAADCDAVSKAALAVELRNTATQTVAQKCKYLPVLKPEASTPALCASGKFVKTDFYEGFDGASFPTAWTQGKNVSGDTDIAPWGLSSVLPAPHSGQSAFFKNNTGGSCTAGDDQSASHFLDTPAITVTDPASFFSFTHFMQSEGGYDGGNLKVSLNGGAFTLLPVAAFSYNGYSGKFSNAMGPTTPTGNNTSPNAGQLAWTGSDQGEATGSWGTTIVDLSKLTTAAKTGDQLKFRFDFANDGCGGNLGWFVEDVREFSCTATAPVPGSSGGSSSGGGVIPVTPSAMGGRFGGGALGWLALLPLAAAGLGRRRRR